jgi:hypothetical protein
MHYNVLYMALSYFKLQNKLNTYTAVLITTQRKMNLL